MRAMSPVALSPERKAALKAYAARNGPFWKRALWTAWLNGEDADEPEGPVLRQIRNACGPAILKRVQLADLDDPAKEPSS